MAGKVWLTSVRGTPIVIRSIMKRSIKGSESTRILWRGIYAKADGEHSNARAGDSE